jgi:zinc protease
MIPQFLTTDNRKVLIYLPAGDEYIEPTDREMQECMAAVEAEEISPYEGNIKKEPLISSLLPAGTIASESHNDVIDATEFTLSNGAKVIVKPTKFKDDEIIFKAFARGGSNAFDDSYTPAIQMADLVLPFHGYGSYNNADMTNYLMPKNVRLNSEFVYNQRSMYGSSPVKNLQTLMELIYASFTEYSIADADYNYVLSSLRDELPTVLNTPNNRFIDSINKSLYSSKRIQTITTETVDATTREQMVDYAQKMMADASDYTFAFVGNIDMDSFKPLVEQYIANLPTDKSFPVSEKILEGTSVKLGVHKNEFSMAMQTPQTYIMFAKYMQKPYNMRNDMLTEICGSILADRLHHQIREEMGATYTVSVEGELLELSSPNVMVRTILPINPDFKDKVMACIEAEYKNMETTVTADELQTAREILLADHKRDLENNEYYMTMIEAQVIDGADFHTDYETTINSITVDDIQTFFRELNGSNNAHTVLLTPEK